MTYKNQIVILAKRFLE